MIAVKNSGSPVSVSKARRWIMFDRIADTYDWINRCMTAGLDQRWRRHVARALNPSVKTVLDIASGTMDVALMIARVRPTIQKIVALDMAERMLAIGQSKCRKAGVHTIEAVVADVHDLPFEPQSFDAVTVAFGVRNFENLDRALSQIAMVLKTGGQLIILESCRPKNRIIAVCHRFFLRTWVRLIGGFFSGSTDSYTYLSDSIHTFSSPEDMMVRLKNAGFSSISYRYFMMQSVQCLYAIR
jgi:demethylmenaquinone methyltransferase/2-methoxy-6-polyprenyl-1,4-benzoquinol methylase